MPGESTNVFQKVKTVDIPFREVSEAYFPTSDKEKALKQQCSKKFQYPFYVVMQKRKYELYAASELDRKMWMSGFEYLIKSSKIVMEIMQENEKEAQREQ